jgi:pSer/pThr/pTyr-binding forkhead associated (FHA) protein
LKLIFYLHDGNVEEFILNKQSVVIGRGKSCDLPVSFEGFSRQHAQIELIDGEIFVTDLGSTNGVFIDGNRIPPSQKTPMQSFLTLQIGSAQRVEVIDDSPMPEASHPRKQERTDATFGFSEPRSVVETSKSKTLDNQLFKKTLPPKKASDGQGKKKGVSPNLLIAVFFIGICVYYFQTNSNGDVSQDSGANSQLTGTPQVALTETGFITPALIESVAATKSCESDKLSWCQDANILGTNQEGVVVEGKSLIVFYNMTLLVEEKHHANFEGLSELKRLEILLLRRVLFSSLPRTLTRQTAFDNFQAIGGTIQNNEMKLKIGLKIRRDVDFKRFDKFVIIGLMDRIINAGEVEELAKLSSLYESLPID